MQHQEKLVRGQQTGVSNLWRSASSLQWGGKRMTSRDPPALSRGRKKIQTAAAAQEPAMMPSAAVRCPLLVKLTDMKGDTMAPMRAMELFRPRAKDRTRVGYICSNVKLLLFTLSWSQSLQVVPSYSTFTLRDVNSSSFLSWSTMLLTEAQPLNNCGRQDAMIKWGSWEASAWAFPRLGELTTSCGYFHALQARSYTCSPLPKLTWGLARWRCSSPLVWQWRELWSLPSRRALAANSLARLWFSDTISETVLMIMVSMASSIVLKSRQALACRAMKGPTINASILALWSRKSTDANPVLEWWRQHLAQRGEEVLCDICNCKVYCTRPVYPCTGLEDNLYLFTYVCYWRPRLLYFKSCQPFTSKHVYQKSCNNQPRQLC